MKHGLIKEDIKTLHEIFEKFPEIKEVLVFGSRAMGNHKKGSDVDLVLKGDAKSDISLNIQVIIDDTNLPYFFDIVWYEELTNENLKKHIDEYGKVIYKRN